MTATESDISAPRSGVVGVELTRTELVWLLETIEVTPVFEGRSEMRTAIREAIAGHTGRPVPLWVEESSLAAVARRIVPIDIQTAALRPKLDRALRSQALTA